MDALSLTALSLLFLTLWINGVLIFGVRKIGHLKSVPVLKNHHHPSISIIVPACNEEATIRQGLETLLALDYEPLEIIVIDDRSTDGTFEVIRSLADRFPQLRVVRLTELPPGWLGKSNALHRGADLATGEYLLFTDADIHMEKSTVSRAISWMLATHTDHLCLFFRNIATGWLLNAMVMDSGANLLLLFKPWQIANPRSSAFLGIGAFNLVRADVYQQVGGHSTIRMHPIDDIMLGKIIKEAGFRQQCLWALEFVTVHWYASVPEMMNGLMKNLFSLFHYRLWGVLLLMPMAILINIVPLWGALFCSGPARLLFALSVVVRLISFARAGKLFRLSPWCVPGALVSPYINIYLVFKAAFTTCLHGGITWRGTFYPLSELKKSRPIVY